MPHVVDPNQQGAARAGAIIGYQVEFGIDIDGFGSRELGDLRVFLLLQLGTHLRQDFDEGKIFRRVLVVAVQNVEEGGSAGTTRATTRVGKGEGSDVTDC